MNRDRLAADLIRDEDERLKPYVDTVGKITIGVGRNLTDVGISQPESRILLQNDINAVLADLDRRAGFWRGMSEGRQLAIANMAFNLGGPRLSGFKLMLAGLEVGDYESAAREALSSKWAQQVGERAQRIAKLYREG